MSENFTREHKLIEEITSKGWFANPAGRQGYEVIVLEQVGDGGTRFYYSLKPGETLRFSERVFGRFTALAVDTRHARSFPVQGEFWAKERGRKVFVRANVRYFVTDARIVAMEAVDPLGELRDKVTATLNRELARYSEEEITPGLIEKVIRSVGGAPHLGLQIEDAEVLEFRPDTRITKQTVEKEDLDHSFTVGGKKLQAELTADSLKKKHELGWKQETHSAIDLTDMNTLLHEHPEMVGPVFAAFSARDKAVLDAQFSVVGPAIQAYIEQQKDLEADIDPAAIIRLMQEALQQANRPQLSDSSLGRRPQITWGREEGTDSAVEGEIVFEDDKPSDDEASGRIKFGD